MLERATFAGSQRSAELRYLTQHFDDLQGLRLTPVWIFLLVRPLLSPPHLSMRANTVALSIIVLALYLWLRSIQRMYRMSCGVVLKPTQNESVRTWLHAVRFLSCLPLVINVASLIMSGRSLIDPISAIIPLLISLFLLPRCLDRAPDYGILQLRLWLYRAATCGLVFLAVTSVFWSSGMRLTPEILAGTLLLLSLFDHCVLQAKLSPGLYARRFSGE